VGGVLFTVTTKLQALVLPLPSVAVHTTVVGPSGKTLPEPGTQATVGAGVQLSVAPGTTYVTLLVPTVRLAGHARAGGCKSCTVTVKLQVLVLPLPSVATHVTVVVPLLKADPLAGVHATVGAGVQLSVAVGAA
jgi:hypothetical protein